MTNQATAAYQIRYTRPDEWLDELRKDRDHVADNIVRLSMSYGHASMDQLYPSRPFDTRGLQQHWQSRWVEASYISTRAQIVKLSGYCGIYNTAVLSDEHNDPTQEAERELAGLLARGIKAVSADLQLDLDIRGGLVYVEDGIAWSASPADVIASAPINAVCITCIQPIHFSNDQWRHDSDGRAEVYDEQPCPKCNGTRAVASRLRKGDYDRCQACTTTPGVKLTLSHLADPGIEGRLA